MRNSINLCMYSLCTKIVEYILNSNMMYMNVRSILVNYYQQTSRFIFHFFFFSDYFWCGMSLKIKPMLRVHLATFIIPQKVFFDKDNEKLSNFTLLTNVLGYRLQWNSLKIRVCISCTFPTYIYIYIYIYITKSHNK